MRFFSRYCLMLCFLLTAACSDDLTDNNPKTGTGIIADTDSDTDTDNSHDIRSVEDTKVSQDTAHDIEYDTQPDIDAPVAPKACPAGTLDIDGDASRCIEQIQISIGGGVACAITFQGTLYCWGYNFNKNQLSHVVAQQVGTDNDWHSIATGNYHICGIKTGKLFCWGDNGYGQLGNGRKDVLESTVDPTQVGTDDDWSQVTASNNTTCAIKAGELFCWGDNRSNIIPRDPYNPVLNPTKIDENNDWTYISVGIWHTCGIRAGELYCWGHNDKGQVGNGSNPTEIQKTPVRTGTENDWTHISPGNEHTCGIRQSKLYCWGDNKYSQLGFDVPSIFNTPQLIDDTHDWKTIATGRQHSCAVTAQHELFCWGDNYEGQLGTGTTPNGTTMGETHNASTPTRVGAHSNWQSVVSNLDSTCGIRDNTFFCWGRNDSDTLGNATYLSDQSAPTPVTPPDNWNAISSGENHSCGIRSGELYCWGNGNHGQLGIGDPKVYTGTSSFSIVRTPTRVGTDNDWTHISASVWHTCGIRNNGQLHCWGQASRGALGIAGISEDQRVPVRTGNESDWTAVSTSYTGSCGIRQGKLYCWGNNNYGPLGLGSLEKVEAPTQVGTETDWKTVVMRKYASCGIRNGELYCWGTNSGGLGDGTTTFSDVPKRVGILNDWTHVTVTEERTCAIRNNETYCWGKRSVGDGTETNQPSPTKISADQTSTDVSNGLFHTCAIWNGKLMCWGHISSLMIDRTIHQSDIPLQVGSKNDWTTISAGSAHNCGLRNNGHLFCWGRNSSGQTGTTPPTSPQPVVGFDL